MTLLLKYPDGRQELRVKESGFQTTAEILWDEDQGPIPAPLLAGYNAAKAKEESDLAKENEAKSARRGRLKNHATANTLPELKAIIKDLLEELGLG